MVRRIKSTQALLEGVAAARANPALQFPVDWRTTFSSAQFLVWFRRCLHTKINRTLDQGGRKFSSSYQTGLSRDARIIRDRLQFRIYRSGSNILTTPELARHYPEIHNP